MDCSENRKLVSSRRALLIGGASFAAWAYMPKFARAGMSGQDPRLIVVILRGALDGLATVAPLGDPDYAKLHGAIALSSGGPNAALPLDSFFALHPAMPNFAKLYREKKAAVVHAAATGYRERSHFDGQDVLESGYSGPGRVQSGWLNRALEELPRGDRVTGALAVGPDRAADPARWCADRRLGAGGAAAGGGGHGEPSARALRAARSGAVEGADARPAARSHGGARRQHAAGWRCRLHARSRRAAWQS